MSKASWYITGIAAITLMGYAALSTKYTTTRTVSSITSTSISTPAAVHTDVTKITYSNIIPKRTVPYSFTQDYAAGKTAANVGKNIVTNVTFDHSTNNIIPKIKWNWISLDGLIDNGRNSAGAWSPLKEIKFLVGGYHLFNLYTRP